MLPIDKPKGKMAYKNLRVFTGIPPELKGKIEKLERIPEAEATKLGRDRITVEEIAREMGWKPKW
mgnify:CR=1 FL=1